MRVRTSVAEQDIDRCIQDAEAGSEGRENLAENAAVSTAGSAAIGAAASLMYSLLRGLFGSDRPAPGYRGLVDRCLRERGYEPVWR